ncbi:MAG: SUF system NifU family Fe-S cluster assembly protein [Fidelibacterota bacterium]|nr:MAG: SUF system NifU family Fe-S cluster assembly protein [Candidatus Neomarinimicrobiota bacterium]
MDDLRELYQQLILDHNQNPRNFREIKDADRAAHGHNPLCGDDIDLYLTLEDDVIRDIGFLGSGCAISKASASIMTTVLKGKTRTEAQELLEQFHRMATTGEGDPKKLGKLTALADVYKFPIRVKCAMLAWRTMEAGLEEQPETITTE